MFNGRFLPGLLLSRGSTSSDNDGGGGRGSKRAGSNTKNNVQNDIAINSSGSGGKKSLRTGNNNPTHQPQQKLSATLAHLHRQQQLQQQRQQQLSHNAAHVLYTGRRQDHCDNNNDDDDDDDIITTNDQYHGSGGGGYALEFDCGESVSSLNDSCFGGASVTGGFNDNNMHNYSHSHNNIFDPSTAISIEHNNNNHHHKSPLKHATSLVVGIVPSLSVSDHPSFDTEDISYFVHDIEQPNLLRPSLLTTTSNCGGSPNHNNIYNNNNNDDEVNSRINICNGRLRTMMPILTGTLSPKQRNRSYHNNNKTLLPPPPLPIRTSTTMTTTQTTGTNTSTGSQVQTSIQQLTHGKNKRDGSMMISETTESSESHQNDGTSTIRIVETTLTTTTTTTSKPSSSSTTTATVNAKSCGCWLYPKWLQQVPIWWKVALLLAWISLLSAIITVIVSSVRSNKQSDTSMTSSSLSSFDKNQNPITTNTATDTTSDSNATSNIFTKPTTTTIVVNNTPSPSSTTPTLSPTINRQKSDKEFRPSPVGTITTTMSPNTYLPIATTGIESSRTGSSPNIQPTPVPTPKQQQQKESSFKIYITAGQYSDEIVTKIQSSIMNLPTTTNNDDDDDTSMEHTFLIHLGDWNTISSCADESSYMSISNLFSMSSIPVYFVMGEKESTSCPDPMASVSLWKQYLLDYDSQFPGATTTKWDSSQRQGDPFSMYNENRLLTYNDNQIAFVTLNVVTNDDTNDNSAEILFRHEANLQWIDTVYNHTSTNQSNVRTSTIIIFVNDGPNGSTRNTLFYTELLSRIENTYTNVNFVIVTRSVDDTTYSYETQYNGISNLSIVNVFAPIWPPMRMTIDFDETTTTSNDVPQISLNDAIVW